MVRTTKLLTISNLKKDSFKFTRGGKEIEVFKWIVWFSERKGLWADSIIKEWNENWHIGQLVTIYDSQWKKREYERKDGSGTGTASTIAPPPQVYREEFDELIERVGRLEGKIPPKTKKISIDDIGLPEEEENAPEDLNPPSTDEFGEVIDPSEIPF